jgi:hypothetical protein
MRKALPQMLDLSRALIAYEARTMQSSATGVAAAHVCDKLRPKLATLMGATGFRALLSRALALASAEIPALCALEIDAKDSVVCAKPVSGKADAAHDIDGGVVLVAQLLTLLVAFIGENLTRQLLLEVWPQALACDSDLTTGDSD